MANPFTVAVPNAFEALMAGEKGYTGMRDIMSDRAQSEARKLAQQDFASGNTQGAIARLLGVGDNKSLQALVQHQAAQGGVFGTPIHGVDEQGNPRIGTFNRQGGFVPIETPGFRVTPGITTITTPQGVNVISSKSGAPVGGAAPQGPIGGQPQGGVAGGALSQGPLPVRPVPTQSFYPADNRGKARDTKLGTEQAEIESKLPSSILQANQTVDLIDELLGDKPPKEGGKPDINAMVGPIDQYRPSWTMGGGGRNALARWEQLSGKAFGAAFDMLRGGGSITEVEGVKASNAYARLQRSQDEADFKAALKDFRDAVSEGARKLAERAGPTGEQYQSQIRGPAPAPQINQGRRIKVRTPAEARRLPSGTPIILPDGSPGTVP
jgi:hypothetical protein